MFAPASRPSQPSVKTEPTPSSAPSAKSPSSHPAPLKDNQQEWERRFKGEANGLQFNLRIQRTANGHLHARYQVNPGKGEGWHLEGQLREDNTFALKGTDNNALFEGYLSPSGLGITASFSNNDFRVEKLLLTLERRTVTLVPAKPTLTEAITTSAVTPNQAPSSAEGAWKSQTTGNPQFDQQPEVQEQILWAAQELNVDPNDLAACLSFESARSFDPAQPNGAGGSAIGLIQFLPPSFAQMRQYLAVAQKKTAAGLARAAEIAKYGWEADKLNRASFAGMTVTEQMKYVVLHFKAHQLAPGSGLKDLYQKILAPFADPDRMYSQGTQNYEDNKSLDFNHDGVITSTEAVRKIINQGHVKQYYQKNSIPVGSRETAPNSKPTAMQPQKQANLQQLLSLDRLTAQQIAEARQFIEQLPDNQRAAIYAVLQSKVYYHNQRNNASAPLPGDVKYWGKNLTDQWGIGFVMCQITALAMSLEYLGIENPDPKMQYEDFLEQRGRVTQGVGWERYTSSDWIKLARSMGAQAKQVYGANTKTWWTSKMQSEFDQGHAVILSVGADANAHVVRVQAITEKGLLIDDPNGRMTAEAVKKYGFDVNAYQINQYKNESSEAQGSFGEDNLWTWTMLKSIPQRYVVILSKE